MNKSPTSIRILIADDHPIFRDGLERSLEMEPDFRVVGKAGDGQEAVRLTLELKPDILLLDLAMPRYSGLDTLRELEQSGATVHTIILAASIDKAQVAQVLQLGARGLVLKESTTELLTQSIRAVMSGRYWIGKETVSDLVKVLRELTHSTNGSVSPKHFGLTARELEIVGAIVMGFSNKEIAEKFRLSEQTVKHHLTNVFDKLGVSNRLEVALLAVHHHLVGES